MLSRKLPFNVELLKLTPARLSGMIPVTSADFYETHNGDLHPNGLFSIPIFGRMGSDERDRRFSYIDIRLEVLHPVIYERVVKLKNLYKGIIDGTHFVLWDSKLKDFVPANELDGHTGYSYFLKYWKQITFVRNDSAIRDMRIELIEKYRDRAMTSKIMVMPAGLRDIEATDEGRTEFSDINPFYRKLVSIASTIPETLNRDVDPVHDRARMMLQQTFNELYHFIEKLLTGKKGFFQDKWSSRRIFNSTRNVITAADLSVDYLGSPGAVGYTESVLGMHQASRMLLPIVIHSLKEMLQPVFSYGDNRAKVVDTKTLTSRVVELDPETFDRWMTNDGLERVVASYGEVSLRAKPVMVEDYYLGLIYRGPDRSFKIFDDIDDLPQHLSRKNVYPLTLVELLYISMYNKWNRYYSFTTRYPVTGTGSIFPASLHVRTTIVGETRHELGPDWEPLGEGFTAYEYPIFPATSFLDSQVVNIARLAGLGADHDGDTVASSAVYSDEAVAELKHYLTTKSAFADPRGGLRASAAVPTIELVALNMLGRV